MRARLLALALIPLVGMALFAELWAAERLRHAERAEDQERTTRIITGVAQIRLSLDIEERVASIDGALRGPIALVAGGARKQARNEIVATRGKLDRQAATIDRLAGRPGAWRDVSARIGAALSARRRSAPAPDPEAGLSLTERIAGRTRDADVLAGPLAAATGLDGLPRERTRESMAAQAAIQRLLDDMVAASGAPQSTAAVMRHAANLQTTAYREMFAVTVRVVRDDWRRAAPDLLRFQYVQQAELDALRETIPPEHRRLLAPVTDGPEATAWAGFLQRIRARAIGDRTVALPTIAEMSPNALPWLTQMGEFPERLGAGLRRRAAERAADARREARFALVLTLGFLVGTLTLAVLTGASIRRPLRRLERRARLLVEGRLDAALAARRREGSKEIGVVADALDDLAVNLDVVQQQASALAAGDTQAPVLRAPAAGPLGEALQRSVGTLSAVSEQLRASEARSRAMIATAADAIWTVGADGAVVSANPAAEALLEGREVTGRPVAAVLGAEIAGTGDAPVADLANDEVWLRRPGGSRVPVLVSTSRAGGADPVWTVFARDISVIKQYEAELSHQAFHDELTGLPNRALLLDRLEHALSRGRRESGSHVALLMVDLDDFKGVNDVLGHSAGDELLVAVAERLQTCLRPGDTAARLGGDEFAVLLEDVSGVADAEAVAQRIVEVLGLPLRTGEHHLAVAASVGIRISDADTTPSTLLRDADTAMYAAKAGGKGRADTFTASMHADATRRLVLRNDLHDAMANDELRLVYQPVIDLPTRTIVAAEALLRWEHPEHGVVPPLDFIPTAEETGLIVPIGRWVLREACTTAATWPEGVAVNVNVSGIQLLQDDAVAAVREALDASGLAPERLVVELTESVLLEDVEAVSAVLTCLKELGVKIAVDDFGTGYCSLAYLKRFPVDHLKIDRAFTEDLTSSGDRSLARSIVDLAGVLGLSAVAEGVETAEQADLLTTLACDLAQGYHFSRPVPPAELAALLAGAATGGAAAR